MYVTGDRTVDPQLLRHEAVHANQYAAFGGGIGFPVVYGIEELRSGGGENNIFEKQAGLADGCYQPRPGC